MEIVVLVKKVGGISKSEETSGHSQHSTPPNGIVIVSKRHFGFVQFVGSTSGLNESHPGHIDQILSGCRRHRSGLLIWAASLSGNLIWVSLTQICHRHCVLSDRLLHGIPSRCACDKMPSLGASGNTHLPSIQPGIQACYWTILLACENFTPEKFLILLNVQFR